MWCIDLFVDDRVGFDPWMVQCPMNVGLPLFINIIILYYFKGIGRWFVVECICFLCIGTLGQVGDPDL